MKRIFRNCINFGVLAALFSLTGCAGSSTFTAYPHKIEPVITSLINRTPIELSEFLSSERSGKDLILYNLELARYAQLIGKTDVSMADYSVANDTIRENDEKASISASEIGANVAAAIVNDNAIPYEAEGYERVLLHHYQALNYLVKNDLDGAGVEVRLANAEQNDSLKRFEKDIEKAEEEAEQKKVDSNNISQIDSQYAQMNEVAGKVKNSFQNAYTFYLSAFIYELLGQTSDAYIDYKKALEIYPDNSYLQRDVIRVALKLDMKDELKELSERFKIEQEQLASKDKDAGELLVFFEDGFVPQKHEIKFPVPVSRSGLISIAFPIYQEKWSAQLPLTISDKNNSIGTTEPICDVRALAVKALKEKIPAIATRQIIRAIAKGATAATAKKKLGGFGELAANVWNIVSERADLRSWLTLPSNAQILRMALPPGKYKLALQHPMLATSNSIDVEIPVNGKTIMRVTRTGGQLYTSVVSFPATAIK